MTRVSDYAHQQLMISTMLKTQTRMRAAETQVSTEKVSDKYSGIVPNAERLVHLEQRSIEISNFVENNNTTNLKMTTMGQSLESIDSVFTEFRKALSDLKQNDPTNEQQVAEIQKMALQSMKDVAAYLNVDIDAQYVFSGSKTNSQPVDLTNIGAASNLAAFQQRWDGAQSSYPISKTSHLNSTETLALADVGDLEFRDNDPSADTIIAQTDQAFANLDAGDTIYLNGTPAGYNGYYTIASIDNTDLGGGETQNTITLDSNAELTSSGGMVGYTALSMTSNTTYYEGDHTSNVFRIDETRTIELNIQADNPAFEKAFRAMGMIAQGVYGTSGGLDQNTGRVDDALWLMDSAMDFPTQGTAPNGQTELDDSIEVLQYDFSFKHVRLLEANESHETFLGFLETQTAKIENADPLESVTKLLDESRALEASYQAIARVNQLSLSNYLS